MIQGLIEKFFDKNGWENISWTSIVETIVCILL
jgi:hypothetical protein